MEGFTKGYTLGTDIRKNQQQRQLGDLAQQYYSATPEQQQPILGQIASRDPQRAAFMQQQQYAQQQQQQKAQQQKLQRAGQLANTVLKADPRQRASVYKATLRAAEKYGMDVTQLPPEYTREVEPFLQSLQGMSGQKEYSAESPIGKIEQDYRRGGLREEDYRGAIRKATTSSPQTQIIMGAEKEEQKQLAQVRTAKYETTQKQASAAEQQNNMLNSMEQALQDPEAYTGAGGNILNEAKILGESLGLDVKGTDSEAIIRSTGNKLALQMRSPDSGMGMPGAMSDPDRRFLVASVPGNTKTRSQNLAMVSMSKKLNNRKIELAGLQESYLESQGTLRGFEKHKKNYVNSHPLFSKEEKVSYKQQLSGKQETANDPLGIR